ncbi:hypothetical protein BH23GEM4_BH23GEM4_21890 [soil metagenome]
MELDFSFRALIDFLDYAGDHGLINHGTTVSYRVAASKIEDDLTDQEASDVRQIEVPIVFQRFVNKNRVKVSPDTLRTYQRRLETAIGEFVEWRKDPTAYKPKGRSGVKRAAKNGKAEEPKASRPRRRAETEQPVRLSETDTPPNRLILTIPFPLRPDFLASIQIPRDLKSSEAERLATFIRTLAVDVSSDE